MYSGMTATEVSLTGPLPMVFEQEAGRELDGNLRVQSRETEDLREFVSNGCATKSKEDSRRVQVIIIIGPGMAEGL